MAGDSIIEIIKNIDVGCCPVRGTTCKECSCSLNPLQCFGYFRTINSYGRDGKELALFTKYTNKSFHNFIRKIIDADGKDLNDAEKKVYDGQQLMKDTIVNLYGFIEIYRTIMSSLALNYYEKYINSKANPLSENRKKIIRKAAGILSENPCINIVDTNEYLNLQHYIEGTEEIPKRSHTPFADLTTLVKSNYTFYKENGALDENKKPICYKYERNNLVWKEKKVDHDAKAFGMSNEKLDLINKTIIHATEFDISLEVAFLSIQNRTVTHWLNIFWHLQTSNYHRFAEYEYINIEDISHKNVKQGCARTMLMCCILFAALLTLVIPLAIIANKI
jgi:hypothetical protein